MPETHTHWIIDCADRCIKSLKESSDWSEDVKHYNTVAAMIAQARPEELKEFVKLYPRDKAITIAPLMILSWRIVGNEYHDELAEVACEKIAQLRDMEESEKATLAIVQPRHNLNKRRNNFMTGKILSLFSIKG